MATTIPQSWPGTVPTLTAEHLATIDEWYHSALRDEDVAADTEDHAFYEGQRLAYEAVLHLLHDIRPSEAAQTADTQTLMAVWMQLHAQQAPSTTTAKLGKGTDD